MITPIDAVEQSKVAVRFADTQPDRVRVVQWLRDLIERAEAKKAKGTKAA